MARISILAGAVLLEQKPYSIPLALPVPVCSKLMKLDLHDISCFHSSTVPYVVFSFRRPDGIISVLDFLSLRDSTTCSSPQGYRTPPSPFERGL